jgi:transcriptional regulator with GAF, ATPase, and Fis domain
MLRRLDAVAAIDRLPVLLTGESGVGKSLIARILHANSRRADGPFIETNCAAIPRDLWESEFFGSSRNAYTHAVDRPGRFAAAAGGTLFLDEIGEIPHEHQAKLLRVLDEGKYERLGEDTTRRADVRVVAATNRDLAVEVSRGRFRPDLYFRIDRFRIQVPSLAERREDIRELATVLADRECKALGAPQISLSPAALSRLEAHEWPGNVRELHAVVSQAVIMAAADGESEVGLDHLEPFERCVESSAEHVEPEPMSRSAITLEAATREFQREFIGAALEHESWNISASARRLGMSRSNLYVLIRQLGVERRERARTGPG